MKDIEVEDSVRDIEEYKKNKNNMKGDIKNNLPKVKSCYRCNMAEGIE